MTDEEIILYFKQILEKANADRASMQEIEEAIKIFLNIFEPNKRLRMKLGELVARTAYGNLIEAKKRLENKKN